MRGGIIDSKEPLLPEEILLSEAIVTLLKNANLLKKYRQKAKDRAMNFKIDNITQEWISLLENLK